MARTNEVAKLFATLGFNVETKNLDVFEKKLQQVEQQLMKLRSLTKDNIKLNTVVSATALKNIGKNIRAAIKDASASSELKIGKASVSSAAIRSAFHSNAKGLGIQVSKVNIPKSLMTQAIKDAGVASQITFSKVKITASAFKQAAKEGAANTELRINKVWISRRGLQDALNAAATNLKLRLTTVQVDEAALKHQLDAVLARYRGMIRPIAGGSGAPRGSSASEGGVHRMALGGGMVGGAVSNVGGLLGGAAAAYGFSGMNTMNQELQAIDLALGSVTGSSEEAAEKMKMLTEMGREMGKTLRDIGPMYTQILAATRGTAMQDETDNVFRGFMKYGTVMGLDSEAMKGSFRAISQMVSKQQVYAEELRGQLAERLPAAVRIAAEVMTGGDTKALNKMMEEGKLDPNELLPKMAKYMEEAANRNGAYTKALETSRVAQGRFNWQLEQSVKLFAESGFDRGMKIFFDTLSAGLRDNESFIIAFGRAFEWAMLQLAKLGRLIKMVVGEITTLGESVGLSKEQLIILSGIVTGLLMPFTRFFTIIGLVATALEDLYAFSQGRESVFGDWFNSLTPERQALLERFAGSMMNLGKSVAKLALMVTEGWVLLLQSLWSSPIPDATISSITAFADAISALVDAITAMGEQDFSKLGELGKALVWGTLRTFTGDDKAYEFLANGSSQIANGVGSLYDGLGNFYNGVGDAWNAAEAQKQARMQQQGQVVEALTIPSVSITLKDPIIGSREEAESIGRAMAAQFTQELENLQREKSSAVQTFKDRGG